MVLVVVTVLGGLAVGYLLGGRIGNFNHVLLRRGWLLAVAVAAQLTITGVAFVGGPVHAATYPLLLASHVALFAFVWANRRLPGMGLIFLGFALNALVIAANGAMPVAPEALERVGGAPVAELEPGKHRLLVAGDRLTFLADVIPVPPLRTVVSPGDLVLAAGVSVLVVRLMQGRARGARQPSWRGRGGAST